MLFRSEDKRPDVAGYQTYFLGPVIFSIAPTDGKKSIIDGQQRITSITLFLIYLNHLQANSEQKVAISELIFSEKFGEKSFNMNEISREECLKSLFETGGYLPKETDDETVRNMIDRYNDIEQSFPEELTQKALPYFIDWFIEKVVLVEITAYSDENAYTIFETMNDRGLSLNSTEMLKGFVLSKISDSNQRTEIDSIWKREIQKLHEFEKTTDHDFFLAWFRGKYAISMRPSRADSENQDFELIGTIFHSWFKDNHESLLKLVDSKDFYNFFKVEFPFFVKQYLNIKKSMSKFIKEIPHLNYIYFWGIAASLQEALLLSTINIGDCTEIIERKTDFVARYIETYTVNRAVNYHKFGQATIKYTMFNLIKKIRNNELSILAQNLSSEIQNQPDLLSNVIDFRLHSQNKYFIKHLLCRISSYVDNLVGKDTNYGYYQHPDGKQFEVEHIWSNKFDDHKDEFTQENDFQNWRNSIGALILLPQGTNQSYGSSNYEVKIDHYLKENTYAQTLNKRFYDKNPNFMKSDIVKDLRFMPHERFQKNDIRERSELILRICEKIWSIDYFDIIQ